MIYEYECKKCKKVQEKMVKMGEKTKERCIKCNASAKFLVRIVSLHAKMKGSWSKWSI